MTNMNDIVRGLLAVALLMMVPAAANAQCAQQYGDIGIAGLECDNCAVSAPTGNAQWRFAAEPRITRIAPGSPADGRLQAGDLISAVNGQPITTDAGARALSRLHPMEAVALTVRRNGATHNFLIAPRAVCPTSALLGMAPSAQVASARGATVTQGARGGSTVQGGSPTRGGEPAQNATPLNRSTPVQAARSSSVALRSNAWVGIAFACRDCTVVAEGGVTRWTFANPPEVYSVETGSPAHRAGIRRGDVITHVDNHSITSSEGGRRWATLQPGETVRVRYRRPDGAGATPTRTATISVAKPRSMVSVPAKAQAETLERELRELEVTLAARDSASARLLRAYQETLRRQMTEQQRVLGAVDERLRSGGESARREAEVMLLDYMKQQERMRTEQQQLYTEALRLQAVEAQRAMESRRWFEQMSAKMTSAPTIVASVSGGRAEQRPRFSGSIRGAEIEVRSAHPVAVTERGNELIITMHDSTIIVRVPDRE